MTVYGYARVSSIDQNEARQIMAFQKEGIAMENIVVEKRSGKDFNRPAYQELTSKLEPGDLLYLYSIDRLGRNYDEILEQWKVLTKSLKIDIVVLDMPLLDTRTGKDLMGTFISDLVLQILSFAAENERRNIKDRQRSGIIAARQRGVKFGRPKKKIPDDFKGKYYLWKDKKIDKQAIMDEFQISQSTFYRWVGMIENHS